MWLTLSRARRRPLTEPSLVQFLSSSSPFSSSSSSSSPPLSPDPPAKDDASADRHSLPPPPTFSFKHPMERLNKAYLTLRQTQSIPDSISPTRDASLQKITKNLRERSSAPSPDAKSAAQGQQQRHHIGFQKLYERNVSAEGDVDGGVRSGFSGGNPTVPGFTSFERIKESLQKPRADSYNIRAGSKQWPGMVDSERERLREMLRELEKDKGHDTPAQELNSCLQVLESMEDKKDKVLRGHSTSIFSRIGGTADYLSMTPTKEHLVEKDIHPDNMSSQEEMKLELAKVGEEFKMSESDCGSSRVQGMGKRKQPNDSNDGASSKKNTYWDEKHDKPFVECLLELVEKGQIVGGKCKKGVYDQLERMMEVKVPGCGVKANPNIRGRINKLRNIWHAIAFMRSGWGWNEEKMCVDAPDDVWTEFEKKHSNCKGLNRKPFPLFEDLMPVFAKGRAAGERGLDGGASGDDSSNDDEAPHVPLAEAADTVMEIFAEMETEGANDNVSHKNTQRSSTSASNEGGPGKKKKKTQLLDDRILEATAELVQLRPLLKQLVDAISRALGETDDCVNKRQDLLNRLEQVNGLSRMEVLTALRLLGENDRNLMSFYRLEKNEDKLMFVQSLLNG